ncbi:MAG: antitoxin [Actinomycetota bacterium]
MSDDGVYPVSIDRGRRTIVTALALPADARQRLSELLGARVLDVRDAVDSSDVDVVLAPSSSPQLVGALRDRFPGASVVVVEVADDQLGVEMIGPVTRLLRGGAEGYLLADSIDELAAKLGTTAAPPGHIEDLATPRVLPASSADGLADGLAAALRSERERRAERVDTSVSDNLSDNLQEGTTMGLFDKAKKLADDNKEKIADGVDKATDVVDDKTGGKFSDQLDKVDEAVEKFAGSDDES